jgi:hypothetical protein
MFNSRGNSSRSRRAIPQSSDAFLLGTIGGAKQDALGIFRSMPDNPAAAMVAGRRQAVYRALETIKHVGFAGECHFERLVVVITAHFTSGHDISPFTLPEYTIAFAVRSPKTNQRNSFAMKIRLLPTFSGGTRLPFIDFQIFTLEKTKFQFHEQDKLMPAKLSLLGEAFSKKCFRSDAGDVGSGCTKTRQQLPSPAPAATGRSTAGTT